MCPTANESSHDESLAGTFGITFLIFILSRPTPQTERYGYRALSRNSAGTGGIRDSAP